MGLINIADCRLLNMIANRIDNDKFRMCDINICNQLLTHNVVVMIISKEKKKKWIERREMKKKESQPQMQILIVACMNVHTPYKYIWI